jgi:hypothetical protein
MGRNEGASIDDEVRSNAMKFVEDASEESRDIGAPVTRSAAKSSSKVSQTVAPPKADVPYSKPAGDYVNPEKGLEKVYPEQMIGGGAGKLLQMAGKNLSTKLAVNRAANRIDKNDVAEIAVRNRAANIRGDANDAASTAVRTRANKLQNEANDTAEIAVRSRANKMQNEANDIKEAKLRMRASKANDEASKNVRARANKALEGMKAGGSVRSSASRRADGCAIRGRTRA